MVMRGVTKMEQLPGAGRAAAAVARAAGGREGARVRAARGVSAKRAREREAGRGRRVR
jgi:hypothetical protein